MKHGRGRRVDRENVLARSWARMPLILNMLKRNLKLLGGFIGNGEPPLCTRLTIHAGFLKLEGSVWPRVQTCLNLSPPSLPWQRRSSLSICGLPSQAGAPGVSTMPGTTTPSSSMVLPVKTKLSPSPLTFASSTNSGRLFNVLSGSTLLPSSLQALSYRRY